MTRASGSRRPRPASTRVSSGAIASSPAATVRRCAQSSQRREQSTPDAVGLISWNEFSENSQVEPSRRFGKTYIKILRDVLGGPAPAVSGFNSDNQTSSRHNYGLGVASGVGGALVVLIGLVLVRAAARRPAARPGAPGAGRLTGRGLG